MRQLYLHKPNTLIQSCIIAVLAVFAVTAAARDDGVELRGTVIQVDGRTVLLEIESEMWPVKGDAVRLGQSMDGIEGLIFMKGEWTVTEVTSAHVRAEPGLQASGTPGPGYVALIQSADPQQRPVPGGKSVSGTKGESYGTSADVLGSGPIDLDEATRLYEALLGTPGAPASSTPGRVPSAEEQYQEGLRVSQTDPALALKYYVRAAEMGHARAAEQAGSAYMGGKGVPPDDSKAAPFFRQAAEAGLPLAQNNYAAFLATGRGGVVQDKARAQRLYHQSAAQGYAFAQTNLCIMYDNGDGVEQNPAEALKFCRMAVEQGDGRAIDRLGWMYQRGSGVEKDLDQAFSYYRKSAELGYANGQNNLAYMYENGWGVTKDLEQAVHWYRESAAQDWATANWNLGRLYQEGKGVPRDRNLSIEYFRRAARGGHNMAQQRLGEWGESW